METRIEAVSNQNVSIFRQTLCLSQYRLSYYVLMMKSRLIRFKHMLIILFALLLPTATSLTNFVSFPILSVIYANTHLAFLFSPIKLLILQIFFLLWIIFQKTSIANQEARSYFLTFNISTLSWLISDLIVIIVADNILWLPIFVALMHVLYANHVAPHAMINELLRWIFIVISILLLQIYYIQNKKYLLFSMVLIDSCYSLCMNNIYGGTLCVMFNMCMLCMLFKIYQPQLYSDIKPKMLLNRYFKTSNHSYSIVLKYYFIVLIRLYRFDILFRLIACAIFSMSAVLLIHSSSISFLLIKTLTIALVMVSLSSWFKKINYENILRKEYFSTFQNGMNYLLYFNITFVVLVAYLFELLFFIPASAMDKIDLIQIIYSLLTQAPAWVFLCWVQVRFNQQSNVLSMGIVVIWSMLQMLI